MKPTQKTSQRPIRDKEAIIRSQWEFRQKNKEIARSAEKRERTERKKSKKNQFLAPQLTIFNRPLLHQTHSLVPKYCERRIPKEKCYLSKHLTCEEKGRVFFEHIMSIMHGAMCGKSDVPCTRVMLPWERQQCARSLRISVPGSLMMVITGAAFRLSREQKKVFWRYSVCWLCKSSRLFPWIKTIKNCFEQLWTF